VWASEAIGHHVYHGGAAGGHRCIASVSLAGTMREGRVLYDDRHFTLARPKALTREELLHLAKLNFEHWFESAGLFFRNCRFCEVQGRLAEAAFLLHQAAERYHHALLLVYTAYKPPTHDLNDLGQRIEAAAPAVAGAPPRKGAAEDERLFEVLRSAYIDARYKKSFRISGEDLRAPQERVLALAARIRAACVEQKGRLGGEVEALRAGLPKVPEREERILAELPVPTEPAELEAWKRELVARAEAEGKRAGIAEKSFEGAWRGRAGRCSRCWQAAVS
jgi:HEPN domain-containing protein